MIDNEKKILHEAEKQMKVLYFKDKLFFDFCDAAKTLDFNPFKNKLKKYYNLSCSIFTKKCSPSKCLF